MSARRVRSRALIAFAISASSTNSFADLCFWDGGGTNNNFSNASNWVTNMFFGPPANDGTDDIIMQGTVRPTPFVDIDFDILSLQFSGGGAAGPFTFAAGGQDLSIRSGGIINNDTDLQIISQMSMGANHTLNAAAGPLRVNFVTLGGLTTGRTLTIGGGFDTIIPNTISGSTLTNSGSIVINSTANFTLGDGITAQANSFTGAITLNNGTLILNKPNGSIAVPGNLVVGDGVGTDAVRLLKSHQIADASNISINSSGLFQLNGQTETINNLTINGGVVNSGTGSLTVSGALAYAGGTFDGAGTVSIAAPFAMNAQSMSFTGSPTVRLLSELTMTASTINAGSGTLATTGMHINAAATPATIAGHLLLPTNQTVVVENGAATDDLIVSATVSGNRLTKTGPGQIRLSNISGNDLDELIVNAGTVVLHGSTGDVSVGSAVFEAAGNLSTTLLAADQGGLIRTNGFQISTTELDLNGGTVTGDVTIGILGVQVNAPNGHFSGMLRLPAGPGGFIDADVGASAVFDGSVTRSGVGGAALFLTDGGTITFAGNVANGSFLSGVTLGTVQAEETKLILAKSVVDGSIITSNLTLEFGSMVRLAANEQIRADVVTLASGTLDLAGFTETLNDVAIGGGEIATGTGTVTLLGDISGFGGGSISGNLRLAGPAIHNVDVATAKNLNISAAISGNVILAKTGGGELRLSGDNVFSGRLRLESGQLALLHDHAAGAGVIEVEGGKLLLGGGPRNIANRINLLGSLLVGTSSGSMTLSGMLDNSFGQSISLVGAGNDMLIVSGPQLHAPGALMFIIDGRLRLESDAGAVGANLQINLNGITFPNPPTAKLDIACTQRLGGLNVNIGDAKLEPGGNKLLVTSSLSVGTTEAHLDINEHAAIVDYTGVSPLPAIRSWIASGRNGGDWLGFGITSSAAASAPILRGIGILEGSDWINFTGTNTFEGETIDATSVLFKFTYNGDTDLNDVIEFDDFVRIDLGFNNGLTGWVNGDFNFSGAVEFDDYVLIDFAFNNQNGTLIDALNWLEGEDRSALNMSRPGVAIVAKHFEQFGLGYANAFYASIPEPSVGCLILTGLLAARRRSADRTRSNSC